MTNKFGSTGQGLVCEELGDNGNRSVLVPDFPIANTVRQLKDAVAREMGLGSGGQSFVLFYGGQSMDDENKPVGEYQVNNGDTIFFVRSVDPRAEEVPPPYPTAAVETSVKKITTLFVKNVDGRNLTLENVVITMTVSQLRDKIRDEKHIDVNGIRLLFGGKELEETKTLMDYNLGNQSTLHIVYRVHGGFC